LQARPAAEVLGVDRKPEELAMDKARCRERILGEAPGAIATLSNARSRASVQERVDQLAHEGRWESLTKTQVEKLPASFVELWGRHQRLESAEKRWPASCLAQRLREQLPRLKSKAGVRTFDDILRTVRDALRDQGPGGPLARAVRDRLRAAILDECQDSDTLQIEVFRALFEHPDIRSFLVIGDPKQSIYRFRGADLASYRALAEHATAAPRMTVNHRSDPALIEALNQLYGPAFQFPDSLAGDRPFDYVPVTAQAKANRLFDPADPGAMVIHASVEDNRPRAANRLASWAAQEIARLLSEPVELIDRHSGQRRRLGPGDIGVLAASHRDLRRVRRALQALGIACRSSGKGLGSVLDSDEALDVLGWLELLE
ncbi:MAG: UvrD-helicase domain-containing protein, partial [Verrucomicrobiota bacterium]